MAWIQWTDRFSVHVALIDQQHRKLVQMVNEFHDAIMTDKSKDSLAKLLAGLAKYAKEHFATEEKYFHQFHFSHTAEHEKEHKAFVAKVTDMSQRLEQGKMVLAVEVTTF